MRGQQVSQRAHNTANGTSARIVEAEQSLHINTVQSNRDELSEHKIHAQKIFSFLGKSVARETLKDKKWFSSQILYSDANALRGRKKGKISTNTNIYKSNYSFFFISRWINRVMSHTRTARVPENHRKKCRMRCRKEVLSGRLTSEGRNKMS